VLAGDRDNLSGSPTVVTPNWKRNAHTRLDAPAVGISAVEMPREFEASTPGPTRNPLYADAGIFL
jgi:hypothetical protein